MANGSNNTGGMGFTSALTIVFITLKLTGNIDWSWWWVLSPMWIGVAVLGAIGAFVLAMYGIAELCDRKPQGTLLKTRMASVVKVFGALLLLGMVGVGFAVAVMQ